MPDGFIPQGSEFQVNTFTTNSQQFPDIASLSDGGYIVTWASINQDGDSFGVYAQRYDADGATVGGEFPVNTETDDSQVVPTATGLADGGFVVTWSSDDQDGSNYGIYAQRYNSDGVAVGSEFQMNTETSGEQSVSAITTLADGRFVVTWSSDEQDGDDFGVYAQLFNANGTTIGAEFQVNTETTDFQGNSSITALADGGFVVTWESEGVMATASMLSDTPPAVLPLAASFG